MTRVLVALAVAILVGAAALPVDSVGVGWLIAALAGLGVAVTARTVRGTLAEPPEPPPLAPVWPAPAPVVVGTPVPTPVPAAPTPAPIAAAPVLPATPPPPAPLTVPRPVAVPPPVTTPGIMIPAPIAPPRSLVPAGPAIPPVTPVVPPPLTVIEVPETVADRVWRYVAGAAALLLTAVPAVRASGPLAVMCLLAALVLGSYALVGGRTLAQLIGAAFSLVPGVAMGARWIVTHRPHPGRPGTHVGRLIGAVVATVVLVAVLIPLLVSADAVFANLIDSWTERIPALDGRYVAGALVLALIGIGAAYFAHKGATAKSSTVEPNRPLGGVEWMIPLVVVDVIFAVFVGVQLRVLFGGHRYVQSVGGPDYADYARGGFGQLCAVTVLSLGLAAGVGVLAKRESLRQRVMIRVVGGLLCALTLVIVASALRRMLLYVDAYGFTWLRLVSFSFEIWLGAIFVLVLAAGIPLRGTWVPRATGAAAAAVLFALVAVDPEALMARTHLERLDGPYGVDFSYISHLSPDVVDEVLKLPPGIRDCALAELRSDLATPDPWYAVNLAREHARDRLARVPSGRCTYYDDRDRRD